MSVIIDYRGKSPNKTTSGVPLITAKIVKGGRIEEPSEFIAEEEYDAWMRRGMPQKGDVVFTTEAPLGEVAQLDGRRIALAQRIIALRGKPGMLDNTFLKFLMQSFEVQEELKARSTGTTVLGIKQSELRKVGLPLPPYEEQVRIGDILGALDDKIELNRRMNGTLEAMAQALFKEWFVDGAKEEWEEKRLEEVADVNWGDTNATKKLYVDSGFTAYSAAGPDGFLPYHDYDRTGIVVSAIGSAGKTYLAMGKWSCIKNTLRFWSTSPEVSTEYLFQATRGVEKWPMRGSVQPFISQGDARAMRVPIPSDGLGARYGEVVRPMYEKIEANKAESRTLAALRDTLLPKLMRGEMRVKHTVNA